MAPSSVSWSTSPILNCRDTEQIPLQEEGEIEGFLRREVLPYTEDAWYVPESA